MLALTHAAQIVGIFLGTALAFAVGLLSVLYLGTRQVGRPDPAAGIRLAAQHVQKNSAGKRGFRRL